MFGAKHLIEKAGIGSIGENMACRFLEDRGYRVIFRNYRRPFGEIDIIAKTSSGILSFIEVKTMKSIPFKTDLDVLVPEDQMTVSKIKKLKRICAMFSAKHPELLNENNGWQIDLICISCQSDKLLTNNYKNCFVKHYENIG